MGALGAVLLHVIEQHRQFSLGYITDVIGGILISPQGPFPASACALAGLGTRYPGRMTATTEDRPRDLTSFAQTSGWQDFATVLSINDRSVPLVQITCPHCGVGQPYQREHMKILDTSWTNFFEVVAQESYVPTGSAFREDADSTQPKKYGHVTLRCKACGNAFYVHYLLKEFDNRPAGVLFWRRLIIPNLDTFHLHERLDESADRLAQVRLQLDKAIRVRTTLAWALGILVTLNVMGWFTRLGQP